MGNFDLNDITRRVKRVWKKKDIKEVLLHELDDEDVQNRIKSFARTWLGDMKIVFNNGTPLSFEDIVHLSDRIPDFLRYIVVRVL